MWLSRGVGRVDHFGRIFPWSEEKKASGQPTHSDFCKRPCGKGSKTLSL